ncbi:MAG: hypothetical protein AAF787_23600 [Chloroflexota bacterium]
MWRIWRAIRYIHHPIYTLRRGHYKHQWRYIMEPGLVWSYLICNDLYKEHRAATYDTLATTPAGPLGVSWLVMAGLMHRRTNGFMQVATVVIWYGRVMVMLSALTSGLPLLVPAALVWLAALYIMDMVLACLLGLWMPVVSGSNFAVFGLILHTFMLLMLTLFSLSGLLLFAVVPQVGVLWLLVLFSPPLLLIAAGEAITRYLWQRVQDTYSASPAEAALILSGDL